jgi:hypothetical protein
MNVNFVLLFGLGLGLVVGMGKVKDSERSNESAGLMLGFELQLGIA